MVIDSVFCPEPLVSERRTQQIFILLNIRDCTGRHAPFFLVETRLKGHSHRAFLVHFCIVFDRMNASGGNGLKKGTFAGIVISSL